MQNHKNLLQILVEEKIFIDNPCNGKGTCGKCKVRVLEGVSGEVGHTEQSMLTADEINQGIRLACLVTPQSDLVIETLQTERKHKVLTHGYMPEFSFNPAIRKKMVHVEKPTLANQRTLETALCESFNVKSIDWRILLEHAHLHGEVTGVFNGEHLLGVEPNDTTEHVYGVAIDIGTTTIAAVLVDLNTGEELQTTSCINPQKKYGLDVLTRISYVIENQETGKHDLQKEIIAMINDMISTMCLDASIATTHVYELTVAANCTMLHFLLGVDASPIGKSPYAPAFVDAKSIGAHALGIHIAKQGIVYCLPSVSAYIGADIVAGAYVCQLHKRNEKVLFIDIGTNGEIVLSKNGKLVSCSCAAGPALEGMNISSGMRAAEGAIEDLQIEGGEITLKVIGDETPAGLCGSGILAAVKELLKNGLVKPDGAFIKLDSLHEEDVRRALIQLDGNKREAVIHRGTAELKMTQKDIRQVQLAKGAILSGFYALLKEVGLEMSDLDAVMIAGQFGAHLPAESLTGVGILPVEVSDKLIYVGNSSKTGAYMALMSKDVKLEIELLAKQMDYMELGATEGYERLFSQCLIFPDSGYNK